MTPTSTENMKDNLSEAGSHLKAAAGAAGLLKVIEADDKGR